VILVGFLQAFPPVRDITPKRAMTRCLTPHPVSCTLIRGCGGCVPSVQSMHFRIPVAAANNWIPSFSSVTFLLPLNGDPRPHLRDRWHCSRLAAPRECSSG
jgi:hypothetical protein